MQKHLELRLSAAVLVEMLPSVKEAHLTDMLQTLCCERNWKIEPYLIEDAVDRALHPKRYPLF
jgi:hypothetical protein